MMPTVPEYTCAICGDTYTSIRAALVCEDADIEDDRRTRTIYRASD